MRFYIAGLCFTDAEGVAFRHDPAFVILSCVVAACGSYTVMEMLERWRSARSGGAIVWQFASATALGGSIWSMHFIAMQALRIDFPISYAPGETALSLIVPIMAVGLGLQICRYGMSWARITCAGITVGLGVSIMHYTGMAALRFPGHLSYTPGIWLLSVLVGIAAAMLAFTLSINIKQRGERIAVAGIMGGAIYGMHYTGMASAVFEFDPTVRAVPGVQGAVLTMIVVGLTLVLLLYALVFVAVDRRLTLAQRNEAASLRRANAELQRGREQFDTALSNISQGLTFFDSEQRLIVSNSRYGEIYRLSDDDRRSGRTLAEILDCRLAAGSFPDMTKEAYLARRAALVRMALPFDMVDELRDGRIVSMHYRPLASGGWVTTHEDITERRRVDANLVFMARHDLLTQLPNRAFFHERLEQAMGLVGRGEQCAVLCLDLDRFKLINDTLGHLVGDVLLQRAGERLLACVREVDTVARLGADEFGIVQIGVKRPDDVELLAKRITDAFREPFHTDGHPIVIGISIGAALAPGDGLAPGKLLKNADIALRLAKAEGRGSVCFFEPEMDARIDQRRLLELDLRGALVRNEFELYYQPLIELETGRVAEFEALIRWRHPVRGFVSPADFIPISEDTGMIVAIGDWVLRTACREAQTWPADVKVAVNLSPVQFTHSDLLPSVESALWDSGLAANRLELEITESVLLQESDETLATLHRLRALGISIALDDFGTGYSSLSYLRRFPFDKIKIDQSFVRDMASNRDSMSIVRAIAGLGESLGMKTTAEGVETLEQLEMLRSEGCTQVQGYFISRPVPAGDVPSLLMRLQPRLEKAVA